MKLDGVKADYSKTTPEKEKENLNRYQKFRDLERSQYRSGGDANSNTGTDYPSNIDPFK